MRQCFHQKSCIEPVYICRFNMATIRKVKEDKKMFLCPNYFDNPHSKKRISVAALLIPKLRSPTAVLTKCVFLEPIKGLCFSQQVMLN